MWEIREDYDPDERRGSGYRNEGSQDYDEGFEDGCEHGYKEAMKKMRMMGMRQGGQGRYSGGANYRMGMPPYVSPYMGYRDEEDDDYEMQERRGRRRDSRGRYM